MCMLVQKRKLQGKCAWHGFIDLNIFLRRGLGLRNVLGSFMNEAPDLSSFLTACCGYEGRRLEAPQWEILSGNLD